MFSAVKHLYDMPAKFGSKRFAQFVWLELVHFSFKLFDDTARTE